MKKFLRKGWELLAALLISLVIPLIIKEYVLKPIRFQLFRDSGYGEVFQWSLSLLLIMGGYCLYVRIIEKRPVSELSRRTALPHLAKGGLWGILSITFILAILALTGIYDIQNYKVPSGPYRMALIMLLLSTTEEVLYRGILHRKLEKWAGTAVALGVSSFLFSIMHLTNDHYNLISFLGIISGGLVMGLMYTVTQSLWWPIAAHFTWNFTQVIMGIRLSGTDLFEGLALFESNLTGHRLLSGGDFGMENSLVTVTYTTAAALFLMYLLLKKRDSFRSQKEEAESTPISP